MEQEYQIGQVVQFTDPKTSNVGSGVIYATKSYEDSATQVLLKTYLVKDSNAELVEVSAERIQTPAAEALEAAIEETMDYGQAEPLEQTNSN